MKTNVVQFESGGEYEGCYPPRLTYDARASWFASSPLKGERRFYSVIFFISFTILSSLSGGDLLAANNALIKQQKTPVYMEADRLVYDKEKALVLAIGNVEVVQGEYILLADKITYFQADNIVQAEGNISLLQPDGNVIFAYKMQLNDDLKKGVISDFKVRMSDNSLFAAREARKVNDTTTKLKKAVYSPCKICVKEDGSPKKPLWQIKASKVKIDEREEKITYRDARFEVSGVPVMYTPYFSHPTPNAGRKSGILRPEYEGSNQLGTVVKVPYYWNISPDKDATIAPRLTSKEGLVLEGEYRQITDNGYFKFNGSATAPNRRDVNGDEISGNEFRGHIFAEGRSKINDNWTWGFDAQRVSDDTYLRRYSYGGQDLLTSKLYTERIKNRDYASIQAISFQGLNINDNPDESPQIVPLIDVHIESNPLFAGSRARLDANTLFIARKVGAETTRLSATAGWKVPHTTKSGHVFELDASVRADSYFIADKPALSTTKQEDSVNRVIPTLTTSWRYPMIKHIKNASLVIEPQVKIIASTNGNNPEIIPNEDSLSQRFSNSNLFSSNRFSGLDRVENGTRAIYAVEGDLQFGEQNNINVLVGQQVMLTGDNSFPLNKDTASDLSDYVGRISVDYEPFEVSYRARIDEESFKVRNNDLQINYNDDILNASVIYNSIDGDPDIGTEETIIANADVNLAKNWTFSAAAQRDLFNNRWVEAFTGLTYHDECVTVSARIKREFIRDRDIEPATTIGLVVTLANLN